MEGIVRLRRVVPCKVLVDPLNVESENLLPLIRNRKESAFEVFHLVGWKCGMEMGGG